MKLTIGKLAKQTNVTIETIRYYQRIGLLVEPVKIQNNYRHYTADTANRIKFIKRAQQVGFSLKEIAELLSLDGSHCSEVRKIAELKCQHIDSQIIDLKALRDVLGELILHCQPDASTKNCHIIDAFSQTNDA